MNLWHDISRGTPDELNVIIEIPKHSYNKYEIDKETGLIALDRVNYSAAPYPFDYGFVPQTLWDDGDALDVVVLTTYPLFPGIMVRVRPVAIINMTDGGDSDSKVVAVPCKDPRFNDVKDLKDINKHTLKEIEHFFMTYKKLQSDEEVIVQSIGGREEAEAAFEKGRKMYLESKSAK